MKPTVFLALLLSVLFAACKPSGNHWVDVHVEPSAYRVGSARYERVEDLAVALKATPQFHGAWLWGEPDITEERFGTTIKALEDASIRVGYVAMVAPERK